LLSLTYTSRNEPDPTTHGYATLMNLSAIRSY